MVKQATQLAPQKESVWRALVEVSQMADLKELRQEAIIALSKLTPQDTTSQLMRLRDAIEGTNTVDARMAVYEQLLLDGRKAMLHPRVSSRLAQRQLGDVNQFARWLAESVALDPSNPDAMALAAGFFGDESADVYRRAELLASALLSNIRDTTLHVALAEFLMAYGDYEDAKVLYELVLGNDPRSAKLISNGLLGDIVLSQWAADDVVAAMDTLLTRQIAVDELYRNKTRVEQPRLTPLELARIHAPLTPKLATLRAAIYATEDDEAQAAITLDSAISSILAMAALYELQVGEAGAQVIDMHLQVAWVAVWLGNDSEITQNAIQHVESLATISPTEKQRLDGWVALRNNQLA
ncbi:MAG TPA: hypothetical protein EYO31_00040, partial [Phycisphaerales bacterium]|nr:hypothetical protein [Phycisphaerales bacterium]